MYLSFVYDTAVKLTSAFDHNVEKKNVGIFTVYTSVLVNLEIYNVRITLGLIMAFSRWCQILFSIVHCYILCFILDCLVRNELWN